MKGGKGKAVLETNKKINGKHMPFILGIWILGYIIFFPAILTKKTINLVEHEKLGRPRNLDNFSEKKEICPNSDQRKTLSTQKKIEISVCDNWLKFSRRRQKSNGYFLAPPTQC